MSKKLNTQDLFRKIDLLAKKRMTEESVVSFKDFQKLRKQTDTTRILIVEDDESTRRALSRIFESEGYKVITASDGVELTEVFNGDLIDVIVLDVGLPWINGYELAELMKQDQNLKEIPLIFVSGHSEKTDIKKGFAVGADDYITKPFQIDEIKKSVQTLIRLTK